jgi:hypothetical protein
MKIKDKVTVVGIGCGWIGAIHYDDSGDAIYSVIMDDSQVTSDGWYTARKCELKEGW